MAWANVLEVQDDYISCDDASRSADDPPNDAKESVAITHDSDTESDSTPAHEPSTSNERRRAQNEVMRAFAADISAHITQEEVEEATKRSIKKEQMSIQDILAKQATTDRITNPRDYQTELFHRAKSENIIAVLDTGTGKTHIATLLFRHVLEEELERRANGFSHRMAFFLVDSVNLVFQQANVLRCSLDQDVENLCGAMGTSLWDKKTWDRHFSENMVIVCTAGVLLECLMHSFITMDRINLLAFDEAHHAKSNHPYARIMKDFYTQELDMSKRPRIFGMTASPVDVKGQSPQHVQQTARDLERLLHSRIATATDRVLASNNISMPEERIILYQPLQNAYKTQLHQHIEAKYGNVAPFQKFLRASKQHAWELGRWASDMYWSFAFTDEQSEKLHSREEFRYNKTQRGGAVGELDAKKQILTEAAALIQNHEFGIPTLSDQDVSYKVQQLHHWLMLYYERSDAARCIVFVEKRQTARLLKVLFDHIGGTNLRCDVLVGVSSRIDEYNITLRSQILTLQKFRRGELNCLFATSVAEEGLDIPQCNLIIRFDLYRTMISYVQSRGRARHRNSKYVHMLERGNNDHTNMVNDVKRDEQIMRDFCKKLTDDHIVEELRNDGAELLDLDDKLFPTYTDPESGAKLTYRMSLSVLNHFAATWPAPSHDIMWQPTYVISPAWNCELLDPLRKGFVCEVILPEHLPLISMTGDIHAKKAIAKCSAAFKMCVELRRKNFLDRHLLPTMHKLLPAQRNALLAVSEKKQGLYPMLIKPSFWKQGRGTNPDRLYLTIVDVDAGLDRHHQPFGLLTRIPLPELPHFPIYLADGRASNVISQTIRIPHTANEEILPLLTKFTLRVYEDIYNKLYEFEPTKMSYWIVPVLPCKIRELHIHSDPMHLLDMEQMQRVVDEPMWQWSAQTNTEDVEGKYLIDPFNGGRRYYCKRFAPDLRAQNPLPAHIPKQNHKYMDSILDYTDSRWAKSRDMSIWDLDQPVFEVEKIPFRRNHLAHIEEKEGLQLLNCKTYVCPQPLRISNLATPFVVMCYILPAIIHRFESYLIALDACNDLDLSIGPALALEALTKDTDNSDEHEEEKLHFKSGMGPNYERLEFLGDCFLKMATSISVFTKHADENEFESHVRRMLMLCNQNLMETAIGLKKVVASDGAERELQLCQYIRTDSFSRRTWYPDGLKLLRGKGMNKDESDRLNLNHRLGDKSVADVCEAFIGAAFMQNHMPGQWSSTNWSEAVKAVKLFANSEDHPMKEWSDYYAAYEKPRYQIAKATASVLYLAEKVEMKHSYRFKYPNLLESAFKHPSEPSMGSAPNYQRLEFLGDSLLDMVSIMHLFFNYPDKDPHWLTEHKSPMVSNKFLAAVCVKLGWYKHIKHSHNIATQIKDYVLEMERAESESNGAVDYWVHAVDAPKCLADVIEAYVGALFVDAEFDFTVVQDFFDMHLKPFFVDMTLESYEKYGSKHPTTRLLHILEVDFSCKDWRVGTEEIKTVIPGKAKTVATMVVIHNRVHFHSLGQSVKYARLRVCHEALEKLEGLPPFEFRLRYGCDCTADVDGEVKMEEAAIRKMDK